MAANLITDHELAVWSQKTDAEISRDPFAAEVMDKVSQMARFFGGQPTWTYETAPFDVKMVVLQVAKRTYNNPDQEVSTTVGPISSRVLDVAALLTELTPSERETLTRYNPDGDPANANGGIWVLKVNRDPIDTLPDATLFVPDDSLSDWYIPMFSPDDPGDPVLYVEP